MATTRQPRERTTPPSSSATAGRRAPRASPSTHIVEKSTPNYLKPLTRPSTVATGTTNVTKSAKPIGSRPPARKPDEKPPSSFSSSSSQRTPIAQRATTKSPSPSRRTSPKPVSAASRATGTPFTRGRSPGAAPVYAVKRRGAIPNGDGATSPAGNDHYASDASSVKSETEEKELPIHNVEEHHDAVVEHLDDIPAVHEPLLDEVRESPDPIVYISPPDSHDKRDDPIVKSKSVNEEEEKPVVVATCETSEQGAHEQKPAVPEVDVVMPPAPVATAAQGAKKEAPKNNEVIEEFKTRMMEKRKNKVLALVGAFETVMSLQEPGQQQQQGKGGAAKPEEGADEAKEPTESM